MVSPVVPLHSLCMSGQYGKRLSAIPLLDSDTGPICLPCRGILLRIEAQPRHPTPKDTLFARFILEVTDARSKLEPRCAFFWLDRRSFDMSDRLFETLTERGVPATRHTHPDLPLIRRTNLLKTLLRKGAFSSAEVTDAVAAKSIPAVGTALDVLQGLTTGILEDLTEIDPFLQNSRFCTVRQVLDMVRQLYGLVDEETPHIRTYLKDLATVEIVDLMPQIEQPTDLATTPSERSIDSKLSSPPTTEKSADSKLSLPETTDPREVQIAKTWRETTLRTKTLVMNTMAALAKVNMSGFEFCFL